MGYKFADFTEKKEDEFPSFLWLWFGYTKFVIKFVNLNKELQHTQ